ncbi:helix-turn-helix domain-containing protein [Mycolicibacter minnesotensis]|nr:helix-turn-helix domain-containing protein [Mycolicibacter minnesotensis]
MDEHPECPTPESGAAAPFKTYSLAEVAALVLPEMASGERWLAERLRSGKVRGYKIGRAWRMTHEDIEDLITRHRNSPQPAEPERYPGGLTRRGWLYRQRYGAAGNPNIQGPRRAAPAAPPPKVEPLPSLYTPMCAEPKEIVETMPPLTETQQQLLQRVEREGTVVLNGRFRKSVEALVRRGLVGHEAAYVLSDSEKSPAYIYRFTVHRNETD